MKEWAARYAKARGKLARHDRHKQRARRAAERHEQEEVDAGRGKQRKHKGPPAPPLTYMCTKDAAGEVLHEWRGQKQVAAHQRAQWQSVLNIEGWNEADVAAEMDEELDRVRKDPQCQVPARMRGDFDADALFHVNNIKKAIGRLKRGSAPGIDRVTADLVLLLANDKTFLSHLQTLFKEWHANGKMGEASRTAVMTTAFKDKPGAERSDWAMYRPVSVTTILYRVYGGCLEQRFQLSYQVLMQCF